MPEIGDKAPDFILASTQGEVSLQGLLQGEKVVLAFYREDATPG